MLVMIETQVNDQFARGTEMTAIVRIVTVAA